MGLWLGLAFAAGPLLAQTNVQASVRLKELGRIEGWQDNALVGYGLVTGLAGTGDSARSRATRQSIANLISQFGLNIPSDQVQSRNVAVVMVMATLPAFARPGSRLDATVTSIGDARSLLGGSLVLMPLKGADGRVHALAQGSVSVGGYRHDALGNLVQKNHPTVGMVPGGASVERSVPTRDVSNEGTAVFALNVPDYTTASRIATALNQSLGEGVASARDASAVEIRVPPNVDATAFLMRVESLGVQPDQRARIIVNERNGVVVSGGDVRLSQVTIAHGELKVSVTADYLVSQPQAPFSGSGARTVVVPEARIEVAEPEMRTVALDGNSTVADLVRALARIKTSPRDMIAILQGMKAAGALHAELVIQ
jgi:flagellar P-ring protein FlgI